MRCEKTNEIEEIIIALPGGAFNNYVDQILSNFDHLPPRVDNCGHFIYYLPFVHVTKPGLSTDHLPAFTLPT